MTVIISLFKAYVGVAATMSSIFSWFSASITWATLFLGAIVRVVTGYNLINHCGIGSLVVINHIYIGLTNMIYIFSNWIQFITFIQVYPSTWCRKVLFPISNYAKLGILLFILIVINITLHYENSPFTVSHIDNTQMSIIPFFNLRGIVASIINLIETLIKPLKKWSNKSLDQNMRLIIDQKYAKNSRLLTISVLNPINDYKVLLEQLYSYLNTLDSFTSIKTKKVLITAVDEDNVKLSLSKMVFIKESTTFDDLYTYMYNSINKISLTYGLNPETIVKFEVLVFNSDSLENTTVNKTNSIGHSSKLTTLNLIQKRGLHTSSVSRLESFIKPIKVRKNSNLTGKAFATMDIETMNINGIQTPVLIYLTVSMTQGTPYSYTKIFIINHRLDIDAAVNNMWKEFFEFINTMLSHSIKTIFVHNLGGFDGLYIYL